MTDPPALVFVDQQYMRELGCAPSPLWEREQSHLTAPTEVHFNITDRCTLSCRHCTNDAGRGRLPELSTEQLKAAIDLLASRGVFHVALGGGELFLRPDAIELAEFAASRGLVPNATTNGHGFTPELARACRVFGQVNVSVDGIGDRYGVIRGSGSFQEADHAVRLLHAAGVPTGLNCLASGVNFDHLEQVVAYADAVGLCEVLFLRVKPAGRAKRVYHELKLSPEQARELFPLIERLSKRYRPKLQVDCSLVPHLCSHGPPREAMELLGVEGCSGGNMLLGVRCDGAVNACSHLDEYVGTIGDLPALWDEHPHFRTIRGREVRDEACRACEFFDLCRGGCPLFSLFLEGRWDAADPECPRLHAARTQRS